MAASELALLLPFLVFLLGITVDYGRIFYCSQIVNNCAQNGAIYGSDAVLASQSPYTSIQQAALADATDLSPQPTVTSTTGSDASGNAYVRVTVNWTFKSITSLPGIPSTVNLSRTVQMRVSP